MREIAASFGRDMKDLLHESAAVATGLFKNGLCTVRGAANRWIMHQAGSELRKAAVFRLQKSLLDDPVPPLRCCILAVGSLRYKFQLALKKNVEFPVNTVRSRGGTLRPRVFGHFAGYHGAQPFDARHGGRCSYGFRLRGALRHFASILTFQAGL